MNQNLKHYLNHYITINNPQYAVLLKGEWGCGKTHFIKQLIEEWNKDDVSDNDGIVLKPIYVSLNGISKIETVNNRIKEALNPFLNSAVMKFGKKILKGLAKSTIKVDFDSANDDNDDKYSMSFEINPFSFLSSDSKDIKGNKVLVFDDVERCKINIDELFGYINNFVEHLSCKVILIGDESKIEQLYDVEGNESNKIHYRDFKEKLVGQTFLIEKNIDDAIDQFISYIRKNASEDYISLLESNTSFIKELFEKTETHNLRILRQSFLDLNRFLEFLPDECKEEEQYPIYLKSVLAYFILTYCEYKSGNKDIVSFENFLFLIIKDETKADEKYKIKYSSFLIDNQILSSNTTVSISTIVDFINDGFISQLEKERLLRSLENFLSKEQFHPLQILRSFYEISNNQFNSLYRQLKNEFYRSRIEKLSRLLDIVAIFFKLDNIGIVKLDRNFIVKKSKAHIDYIFKKNKSLNINTMFSTEGIYIDTYDIVKQSDFSEICNYAKLKEEKIYEKIELTYIKNYFENISDSNFSELYDVVNHELPDGSKSYSMTSIFKDVSAKKIVTRIISFNNINKKNFTSFIRRRYYIEGSYAYGEIYQYHIGDLHSLQNIKKELESKIRRTKLIDKFCLEEMINVLDEIILKLEPLKDTAKEF